MEERHLTTEEAAQYLRLSKRTLEGFRSRGGGPTFRRKGRNIVRYLKKDLDAWLEEQQGTDLGDWQ